MTYIQLTYSDLALPALLVVMNGALSVALHLKLERQLAIASARMVVQLVLVDMCSHSCLPRSLHSGLRSRPSSWSSSRRGRLWRGRSDDCEAFGRTVSVRDALYWLRVR